MGIVGGGGGGAGFQLFTQSNGASGVYADAAARDVYFGANPTELLRLDANEFLIIKLLDDGAGDVAYQQRAGGNWLDVTSVVQGETGAAGATGNSYFFNSITARDDFFSIPGNEGLLENGLPVVVNIGNDTTSQFVWGGGTAPPSYDDTLWRLSALEVSSGTLYLGESGANINSGSEVMNFIAADGGKHYMHGVEYDDTGSTQPYFWKLPALSQVPIADVSSSTLSDPQTVGITNTINSYIKEYTLIPATSGELRVQTWLGTDDTGASLVDTYITVDPGDVGNQTVFTAPNDTLILTGQDTYTKFSGIQLNGGLQTLPPLSGQTTPFITLGVWVAESFDYVTQFEDNITLKAPVAGTAQIEFTDSSDTGKGSIGYDEATDFFRIDSFDNTDLILTVSGACNIGLDKGVPISTVHMYEGTTNTGANAGFTIEQAGAGDAVAQFLLDGSTRWVIGGDRSAGGFFKIASSADLDTDAVLSLDPDGHADFSSSVSTLFGGFGSAQNLVKYSQDLENAEWSELGSISVSSNDAVAPDGTTTADTVTWTSAAELRQDNLSIISTQGYYVSFWGRHVSGATDVGLELGLGTTVYQTLTSTWKKYDVLVTAGSSSLTFNIQALSAAVFELWGFQISDNIDVLSYTRTKAEPINTETTGLVCNGTFFATDSTLASVSITNADIGDAYIISSLSLPDNATFSVGNSNDLTILHNGTDSKITNITGDLIIDVDASVIIDSSVADTQELMTYTTGGTNGGTAKIYVGSRIPEGNVTADGGSIYFRDDGTSSDLYIKRSDSSNTEWFDLIHADSGVKGPASSIQYSIARFDDTTGKSIDAVGAARLVLTASDTALVIGPQLITGNDEIIFEDITNAVVGSIVLDTNTGHLTTTVVGGDLVFDQQGATNDIDIFLGSDDLLSEFAIFNDSEERIFTVSGDKTVSVHDSVPIKFGTGGDLAIMHNGTNSTITNITGDLNIDVNSSVFIESSTSTAEPLNVVVPVNAAFDGGSRISWNSNTRYLALGLLDSSLRVGFFGMGAGATDHRVWTVDAWQGGGGVLDMDYHRWYCEGNVGMVLRNLRAKIGADGVPASPLHVYEDTTEISDAAGITIEQDGTGDAVLQYLLTGGQRWASGIDNTDDKYKIASGAFGNMEALAIDTDYHVALTNSIGTPFGGLGKIQNYLRYSQDFDNSDWQKILTNPPTVVANNAIAPDGSLTADTVTFPGPGAGLLRQGGLATSASTAYTVTGWVKHVSGASQIIVDLMDGGGATITADNVWKRYSVQVTSGTTGTYLDIQRNNFGIFQFWGWQVSDGSETTPYAKTLDTSLDTVEYGSVSNSSARLESREVSTVGIDVVEVWSLDDLPDPVSDVITLPSKFYRFKTSVDFGVNQVNIENFDTVLMDCDDAFINTVSYSGTLPWFIGQGNIRLAGKGITLRLSSDNATMFDIDGGFGADFSTLWADADGCTIGEIRGPFSAVASGLAGVRFFMSRCLITGFKYGAELSNIDYLSVSTSNIFDAADAIGPQISLSGESRFAFFEVLELGLTSATGSFINIDPASIGAVNIRKTILTGDSDFYTPGTTGGISVFADASVGATGITSVSDVSSIARFNFSVGPTLFVGQQVVMSALTNYANGTFYISATGAGYFEIGSSYNGADTGSFLSNSVTVVTGTTPPAELDSVLITGTMEYNIGSVIYNRTGSNFRINAVWDTAETTGTWDTSSLNESSKYVEASGNGSQRDSKKLASVFISGNLTATSITGIGTYDPLNLVSASIGQANEEFVMVDAATGEVRYDGVNPFEGTVQASISALKAGGAVTYRFRIFKTVGSVALDAITVSRGVTTTVGSITLVSSISMQPGDQFRCEVESLGATNDLTITDFAMVVE